MLVKWAIEGRRKRNELEKAASEDSSSRQTRPVSVRNPSSFMSNASTMQTSEEHLTSELDRLDFAHRAALERSSETANDSVHRQHQQEEKAISLRDDVLMESGADPRMHLGRHLSDGDYHHEAPATISSALTTENMQRFARNDRMATLRKEHSGSWDDESSANATIGEDVSVGRLSRVPTSQVGTGNGGADAG